MNRQHIYYIQNNETTTFAKDHLAPPLPLPKLENTLDRYYQSLVPFGTEAELRSSKTLIEDFKNGIGKKLQAILEERAKNNKNWVSEKLKLDQLSSAIFNGWQ